MKRKAAIRLGVLAFWATTIFWLLRYEAFPEVFTHSLAGYEGLLDPDTLLSDSWMRILHQGRQIGYSRTNVTVDEYDAVRHIVIENRVHLKIEVLGREQRLASVATAYLDLLHNLQHFEFSLNSTYLDARVEGARDQGRTFDVAVETGSQTNRMRVDIPDDVILYSPAAALALKRLRVGERLSVRTLNPVTMSTTRADVRALREETIDIAGEPCPATVLEVAYLGTTLCTWISPDGEILRQETPFGWLLEKCAAGDAVGGFAEKEQHGG